MKIIGYKVILSGSLLLIVFNVIASWGAFDVGFWMRVVAASLLAIAMFLAMRNHIRRRRERDN